MVDQPTSISVWLEAARPRTLPAALTPVVVGSALAWRTGAFDPGAAILCLGFSLLVQIGTNFANDYYDYVKGADTEQRVGPRRAVAAGLVPPDSMRRMMWATFGLAFTLGLALVAWGGWWLLIIGVASIVCGIAYTGGPWPLGYNGLGDLFVFLFFGLVAVSATFYVQTGRVTADVVLAAAAVGLLAVNILVVNNYRDADTDALAGKKTLVVRFGRRFAVRQYTLSIAAALLIPVVLAEWSGYHCPVMLPLLLTPWAVRLARRLGASTESAEQIRLLTSSGKFLAAYGLLLGSGIVLA
ncbi:MAG: 1,4-dihydroxy-2-naphthoate polyprenyltransferase [Opitutaceae bacterium]|nr:1,4-dihydroxy-2-naphthoate polyprenyltransferase [Opitutaceae bacterium]